MVRIITVDDVKSLIRKVTLTQFLTQLIEKLETAFSRWSAFEKIPRVAARVDNGVIELMPIWDGDYYSVKYVNGHPSNTQQGKQTVVGVGLLADVATGYPVLISEMTLLTALRTAATSALASKYLARSQSKTLGIVGTGAQSEFQVLAHSALFHIESVNYFDRDVQAMDKFARNLSSYGFRLQRMSDIRAMVNQADIMTTATAGPVSEQVIESDWITPGLTINAIGGDRPGRTELDPKILERSKIVVEFLEQSKEEGEIQNTDPHCIYAELWELVQGKKPGRQSDEEIFLFDSVGFALEDYVVLRLVYSLAEEFHVGHQLDMIPEGMDPKNLFGLLN